MGRFSPEVYRADTFIETGTFEGESLERAAASGRFKQCISIDISDAYLLKARQRLRHYSNVRFLKGSSPDVLKALLTIDRQICEGSAVFWLDAHYQGGPKDLELDSRYGECPVIEELRVIFTTDWKIMPTVLIDDARMFFDDYWSRGETRQFFDRSQWPTMEQIRAVVPPGYGFEARNDVLEFRWDSANQVLY